MHEEYDFTVPKLGNAKIPSPIALSRVEGDKIANYVSDDEFIMCDVEVRPGESMGSFDRKNLLERAGPREKIYFNPHHVHAGIITCGGLCPGLNDVIRALVRCLWFRYGVRRISGIQYGYKGFLPDNNFPIIELDPLIVDDIHKLGGTILGSSRGGGRDVEEIVDAIERMNLNMLFTIGGDGTLKGALAIAEELDRRKLKIAVVGIPKTIDNDLSFIERSFGFETAVAIASEVVACAHTEAHSAINGIGLVKVMGRESGFIAAYTALAVNEANFVLIPEVGFDLDGENGLFFHLKKRLLNRKHAVIIVAEGAGQRFFEEINDETDASGNKRLGDIGVFLKQEIGAFFKQENMEINLKYIDPSYIIRSAPAVATDSVYCSRLANNAVHAAMSGRTKIIISHVNDFFVHLPISMAVSRKNYVDPEGSLWRDVLEATHQPVLMQNKIKQS